MNVSLTPELEELIHEKVRSGLYHSASEVVRQALRLLDHQDKLRAAQLASFQSELDARLASLDRGEGLDGEEVMDELAMKGRPRKRTTA